MKKLIAVSMIVAGTLATAGAAAANSVANIHQSGWQLDAFNSTDR
jgi:flagellar basal body rod protein FlgF